MPNPTIESRATPRRTFDRTEAEGFILDAAGWTFVILAMAAAGMTCLMTLLPATGHDQMWLLYAARQMLSGHKLYGPEILETNPPLIVWLSVIPVTLADLLHLPTTLIGKALVLALEAGSGWLCLYLLQQNGEKVQRGNLIILAFALILIDGVIPVRDFGQRDHLLVLLLLPYVVAAARRAQQRPLQPALATLIGVAAATGIALKPHHLTVFLATEAVLLLKRRQGEILARPEGFALLLGGMGYLFTIRVFTPEYFTQVLPLVRDTYWAFGHRTLLELLLDGAGLFALAALSLALAFRRNRTTPPVVVMLLTAGGASSVAFLAQRTGWYYQQLPAITFFAWALVLQALDLIRTRGWTLPRWSPLAATALAAVALPLTAWSAGLPFTPARQLPIDQPDASFFAGLAPGTAVMTLSPTVDDVIPPLYRFHLTLGQRSPHFFMLPALLRLEDPDDRRHPSLSTSRIAELDRLQHVSVVEDLRRWRPKLILVERCQDPAVQCQVLEDRHDNLLAFFLRDADFRRAFARYHYLRTSGPYDAYVCP